MAFSHTQGRSFSSGSSTITASKTYTGSGENNIDETLIIGTNTPVAFTLDVSALQSLYISADAACDIYCNDVSGGSPTKHIALAANEPYTWPMGGNTNPMGSVDVTGLYVTNAAAVTISLRALTDATP